jgi:hypothetical protein
LQGLDGFKIDFRIQANTIYSRPVALLISSTIRA